MPTIFDLEKYDKDPLDLVKRHKNMVRHLRSNEIDGQEICKMLTDWHGLKISIPISMTERGKQEQKQTDYAIRHAKALITSEVITDEEKDYLCNIINRLFYEQVPMAIDFKLHPSETENAKRFTQMIGRQVAAINKYIQRFNKKLYRQNDVFDLIGEIFEVTGGLKYTRDQIKNFDKNNC